METTTIYIIDENNKFKLAANVDSSILTGAEITIPPPAHNPYEGQTAVWEGDHWIVGYVDEGAIQKWEQVRRERNQLLAETDWTQLRDVTMDINLLNEVGHYRQSLRDITKQDINHLVWPENPLKKDK